MKARFAIGLLLPVISALGIGQRVPFDQWTGAEQGAFGGAIGLINLAITQLESMPGPVPRARAKRLKDCRTAIQQAAKGKPDPGGGPRIPLLFHDARQNLGPLPPGGGPRPGADGSTTVEGDDANGDSVCTGAVGEGDESSTIATDLLNPARAEDLAAVLLHEGARLIQELSGDGQPGTSDADRANYARMDALAWTIDMIFFDALYRRFGNESQLKNYRIARGQVIAYWRQVIRYLFP